MTGASGFLASFLIPQLAQAGWSLLLVGREPARLQELYPEHRSCSYDALPEAGAGAEALIHLAVRNSDAAGTAADFTRDNVTLVARCLEAARAAGVRHFIYTSSLQATPQTRSAYGASKFQAETLVSEVPDMTVTLLRLPAVYGQDRYRGKLAILLRVPAVLRPFARDCLAALRPVVHERRVSAAIGQSLQTRGAGQGGRPQVVLVSDGQRGNAVYAFGKAVMDIAFALVVIGLFWWLLLGLWAATKLTSPGPGLFVQTRLGRGQTPFRLLKFRTMAQGTADVGTHDAPASAVTPVGAVLRRLKLDELPQVWNILRGQLSLVGPRPGLPVQHALTTARQASGVFEIRPGITGLAQIRGIDMSTPDRLARVDAEYIAQRTWPLDIRIALATFLGRGRGDPAQPSEGTPDV